MNRLSDRPLSMLTLTPCCSRSPVKASLVNWALVYLWLALAQGFFKSIHTEVCLQSVGSP